MVCEHGLEDFLFLAAQDIDVALGVAVRIEIDVVVVHFPVQQLLAALDVYALPGRAFDFQAEFLHLVNQLADLVFVHTVHQRLDLFDRHFLCHLVNPQISSEVAKHCARRTRANWKARI